MINAQTIVHFLFLLNTLINNSQPRQEKNN